jgi:hypothetical protein
VQIRLTPFSLEKLSEVGRKVRDLFPAQHPERIAAHATDAFVDAVARDVAGALGANVGTAPRLFLKKFVDQLDKIDQFAAYDPAANYKLKLDPSEMTTQEKAAAGIEVTVDDLDLDLGAAEPTAER